MIFAPETLLRGFGANLVVKPTNHYCKYQTEGGMTLPDGGDTHIEKKYDIGEVVTAGPMVNVEVSAGDIVIWQCTSAWRLPNGSGETQLYHIPQSAIVAILPNPNLSAVLELGKEGNDLLLFFHERNSGFDSEKPAMPALQLDAETIERTKQFITNAYSPSPTTPQ